MPDYAELAKTFGPVGALALWMLFQREKPQERNPLDKIIDRMDALEAKFDKAMNGSDGLFAKISAMNERIKKGFDE